MTKKKFNPFMDVVDTNNDGEVSKEELNSAIDKLAGVETELTAKDMVRAAEKNTHTVIDHPEVVEVVEQELHELTDKPVLDLTGKPTLEILTILFPPSAHVANKTHTVDWARHSSSWANSNDCHFLGFCMSSGEPLFKERK